MATSDPIPNQKYVIALDQGTTSSRAIVFDSSAVIKAKAQYPFEQIYPQPGWVEHDPDEILRTQLQALRDVSAGYGSRTAAIGITNQRETTIVWNKRTGRPVYNAIVWQCRRTADICDELKARGLELYIHEKTGLLIDAYFSATKIKWILDNVPGARAGAEAGELLFGTVDTWIIWNLTGGRVHTTDYSNASRTMLFDIDGLCWDERLCAELGIPVQMLPRPVSNSEIYGCIDGAACGIPELDGVPVCGSAGDQQAALFGQTFFDAGEAKNTYGTGCFTLMNTGHRRVNSSHGLVSTVAWSLGNGAGVTYALEGSVFNGGSTIQWIRDELGLISSSHECDILAAEVPDNGGVYVVPAFTGLGAPYWDMYARGTITGLTRGANKRHIARAVLECIAYQVADLVTAMTRDLGSPLKELRADGGASVSDIMMQFQSDILCIDVNRPEQTETTAMGAAFLAGLAAGVWHDTDELRSLRRSEHVFTPDDAFTDADRRRLLDCWHRAVDSSRGWAAEDK